MKSMLLLVISVPILAGVVGAEISYDGGGVTMKGYLAYNDQVEGPRPGVLVVHEWWGHNDYARKRADMLAELGYTALAVDMYGNGKQASHPQDAGKFVQEVIANYDQALERFKVAMELLRSHPTTDPAKTAAIGYCFGGATVLNVARAGFDLAAVVSFHGSLGTQQPVARGVIKGRVLVCHGADDPFVSAEEIDGFKKEMESAGVNYEFIAYPDAKHSFTNPGATEIGKKFELPLEYNQAADEASWNAMKELFAEVFR